MTTIVAINVPGKGTTFGSDTQITGGNRRFDLPGATGKWIVSDDGKWALGCSGGLRTANIINAESESLFTNLDNPFDFVQRLQAILKDYNFSLKQNDEEDCHIRHPSFDCGLILASAHGIWEIDFDFAIIQHSGFVTAGSGGNYAAGALVSTKLRKPRDMVVAAINAAAVLDPYTGGNVVVGEMKV